MSPPERWRRRAQGKRGEREREMEAEAPHAIPRGRAWEEREMWLGWKPASMARYTSKPEEASMWRPMPSKSWRCFRRFRDLVRG